MMERVIVTYFNGEPLHSQRISAAELGSIDWDWVKEADAMKVEARMIESSARFVRSLADVSLTYSEEEREAEYLEAQRLEDKAKELMDHANNIGPRVQLGLLYSESLSQLPEQQ